MTTTSHQRVVQAIEFRQPDRVPIVFWNRDQASGDVMLYHLSLGTPGDGSANAWDWSVNEWGYRLEKLGDGTMGHPVEAVYRSRTADSSAMLRSMASWGCRPRTTRLVVRRSADSNAYVEGTSHSSRRLKMNR